MNRSYFCAIRLWSLGAWLAFLLTACDALPASLPSTLPGKATPANLTETQTGSSVLLPTVTPTERQATQAPVSALATQVLALDPDGTHQPVLPSLTPLPDPLKLVYPTAALQVISAWRPPLYPVPWAPTPYDHFYFSRPIAADKINWPTADYRYGGMFFKDVVHTGIDISAAEGTPILAAGPGKIIWAGYGIYRGGNDPNDPYGLAVVIRHDFGYAGENLYTVYGHLSEIDVLQGQHVETGERIALSGQTGNTTGPHLHFEVRIGNNTYYTTRNPELWIAPPQGWGILAGRVMDSSKVPIDGQLFSLHNPDEEMWTARSYGKKATNSDPYYRENFVIGDLPAGTYDLYTHYKGILHYTPVQIYPGMVTYFTFSGYDSFEITLPVEPGASFTPQPLPIP